MQNGTNRKFNHQSPSFLLSENVQGYQRCIICIITKRKKKVGIYESHSLHQHLMQLLLLNLSPLRDIGRIHKTLARMIADCRRLI